MLKPWEERSSFQEAVNQFQLEKNIKDESGNIDEELLYFLTRDSVAKNYKCTNDNVKEFNKINLREQRKYWEREIIKLEALYFPLFIELIH